MNSNVLDAGADRRPRGPRVRHRRRDVRDRERGERLELERLVGGEHTAVRRERPGRRPQRGAAVGPAAERRDAADR